jgi:hypothetical protein
MEQVTPIYNWASATFKYHNIFGSEYLGYEYPSGTVIKGIRHEDIENLSFTDNQLDLIISNVNYNIHHFLNHDCSFLYHFLFNQKAT